jgi:hypothetical protein
MTPYDRAWDMGSNTEYMWSYDSICHVVRIPDVWRFVHDNTYWYVLVHTGIEKLSKIRTSMYFSVSITVHGCTWWYMAVQAKFYDCTWWYMPVAVQQYMRKSITVAILALHCLHNQWPLLQVMACTNSIIHPLIPPLLVRAVPLLALSSPSCPGE